MSGAIKSRPGIRCHRFPDGESLFDSVTAAIAQLANQAIEDRNAFHLVLAGGTTPLPLYRRLGKLDANWNAWQLYFGDERCLPQDHRDRNSALVKEAWLNKSTIPMRQIHIIAAESGADAAAREYARLVAGVTFDLVLLGLGEDGHTASLFDRHDWGEAEVAPPVLAVHGAPKPPPERVSLSARRMSDARRVFFLVLGEAKLHALGQLMAGATIPASAIQPRAGVDIYTDIHI